LKLPKSGYVAGALLALLAAAFLSAQEPLSSPAAHKLTGAQYVFVNQIALLAAAPVFLVEAKVRSDFLAILSSPRARLHLVALTAVGLAGLTVYNLGLRDAHPVVISAILNLSPFWAALAARVVAGVAIPVSVGVFAGSLLAAFAGAMTVAYSQTPTDASGLAGMFTKGSWCFAIPVPLFTALSGTLVGLWFKDYRDAAAISSALVVSAAALIPLVALYLWLHGDGFAIDWRAAAMLAAGAIAAAAVGRLLYQFALSKTGEDNGFVTMFFLLGPALSGLYSWLLSPWVDGLRFSANAAFFIGLTLTAVSLFFFASRTRNAVAAREPGSGRKV
jgi:drug/metabolite transporter (DMT)-like permease